MRRAIVLFAHGSRDPLWSRPMEAVAERVAALDSTALVRCAYLELMQPDMATAVQQLVHAGATSIRIVPMFLGVGRHAREDLPELMDGLKLAYPQLHFDLAQAIGEDVRVIQLLAEIAVS